MYVDVMKAQEPVVIEGFEYKPMSGSGVERVRIVKDEQDNIHRDCVVIESSINAKHKFPLWKNDIPKLIRALQAAQKELGIPELAD